MGEGGLARMKKRIALLAAAAVVMITVIALAVILPKTTEKSFFAMNTVCTAKIKSTDSKNDAAKIESIVAGLEENVLSRQNGNSLTARLNSNGGGEVDEKMGSYMSVLLDVCKKSGGSFDFTLGEVSDIWGFGAETAVPNPYVLYNALKRTGYEKLDISGSSVTFGDKFLVDFGAAGKGIALDEIRTYLDESETKEAVISIGGSILLYGEKNFSVGIRNPEGNAGSYVAILDIPAGCVSTSGSYERYFEEDGKIYHHIIDPETGYPAKSGVVSVTVVSESGILSDALSTACFVLGIEKGAALAAEYGCETVFIDENKTVFVSDGLRDRIEITDAAYSSAE